jgi:hypothetical protein
MAVFTGILRIGRDRREIVLCTLIAQIVLTSAQSMWECKCFIASAIELYIIAF